MAVALAAGFPPPPDLATHPLEQLLADGAGAAALARGLGRMMGVMDRTETYGPEVLFALRCSSGSYARACGATRTLHAGGADPLAEECVFRLQKGGVALHMRTTLFSLSVGALVATATDAPGEQLILGAAGSTGVARKALEAERFTVKQPLLATVGLPECWSRAVTIRTRSGAWLGERAGGELRLVNADVPTQAELFFLVDPRTEQARVNAFRAQTGARPAAGVAAPAPSPTAPPAPAPQPPAPAISPEALRDALRAAMQRGDAAEVQALLASALSAKMTPQALAAALNAPGERGQTLLHEAVCCGSADVVRALLACGARRTAEDADGDTPLHLAGTAGDADVAELLLHRRVVNAANTAGCTPLLCAAASGDAATVRVLLRGGADAARADAEGSTPLHVAAQTGGRLVARALLEAASDNTATLLAAKSVVGSTPLHDAAWHGKQRVAAVLLEFGAATDARNDSGHTPLECAVMQEHMAVALMLAEHAAAAAATEALDAADLNATEEDGGSVGEAAASGEDENADGSGSESWDDCAEGLDDVAESAPAEQTVLAEQAAEQVVHAADAAPMQEAVAEQAAAQGAAAAAAVAQTVAHKEQQPAAQAQPAAAKKKKKNKATEEGKTTAGAPNKAPKKGPPKQAAKAAPASGAGGAAATPSGNLYKTALCRNFPMPGGCRHGDKCHFAHGDAKLRRPRPAKPPPRAVKADAAAIAANAAAAVATAVAAASTKPKPKAAPAAAAAKKKQTADALRSAGGAAGATSQPFTSQPFPTLGKASNKEFDAHAETLAAAYMRWLGFTDATAGGIHAADRGVDVRATGALAQVKAHLRVPCTSREPLARLVGDTQGKPYAAGCRLLFFAMKAYSQDALAFSLEPPINMALFLMEIHGGVEAANAPAAALVAARRAQGGAAAAAAAATGCPAGPMCSWSRDDVQSWLRALGLEQYAHSAAFRPITGAALAELVDDDLAEMGVNITAHRRIMLRGIAEHAA